MAVGFRCRPPADADRAAPELARRSRTGFSGQLFKTGAFLADHPFSTVPAAFSPDGEVGIFESNAIAWTVARLRRHRLALHGDDPYTASRIDGFLDLSLADIVFAAELCSFAREVVHHERLAEKTCR